MSFRENILGAISAAPKEAGVSEAQWDEEVLDDVLSDDEDQEQPQQEVIETKPEVAEPPVQQPAPAAPVDDTRFSEFQSKLDMVMNQNQLLLNRLVDKVQPQQSQQYQYEQADTGVTGGDPYFATRDDIRTVLQPLTTQIENTQKQVLSLRAGTIADEFQKTERLFREKYGDDFDKYVPADLRKAAFEGAQKKVLTGEIQHVDWAQQFDVEFRVRHYNDLVAEKQAAKQKQETLAKQQEELKKVSAMPRGTTSHQAPVAPKRKDGESRSDSFRNIVKSVWNRSAQ